MEDNKEWHMTNEHGIIYIKPEDVPVCLVKNDIEWKPMEDSRTRYGMIDDPWDSKYMYEYYMELFGYNNQLCVN